jgi:hypothetical protein
MVRVRITGWRRGLRKIDMVRAILHHRGPGLQAALDCTDALLAGKVVTVEVVSAVIATRLVRELEEYGATAEIAGDLA